MLPCREQAPGPRTICPGVSAFSPFVINYHPLSSFQQHPEFCRSEAWADVAALSAGLSQAKLKVSAGSVIIWGLQALPSSFLLAGFSWIAEGRALVPCWLSTRASLSAFRPPCSFSRGCSHPQAHSGTAVQYLQSRVKQEMPVSTYRFLLSSGTPNLFNLVMRLL